MGHGRAGAPCWSALPTEHPGFLASVIRSCDVDMRASRLGQVFPRGFSCRLQNTPPFLAKQPPTSPPPQPEHQHLREPCFLTPRQRSGSGCTYPVSTQGARELGMGGALSTGCTRPSSSALPPASPVPAPPSGDPPTTLPTDGNSAPCHKTERFCWLHCRYIYL